MTTLHDAQAEVEPRSGLSWAGHNVHGDKESIVAVKDALHFAGTVPGLKARLAEAQQSAAQLQALTAERDALLDALSDLIDACNDGQQICRPSWISYDSAKAALSASSTQKENP